MLEFTDLFTQSPGDFFYHIIVLLALSAALTMAYGQRGVAGRDSATAYAPALTGALVSWFLIVIGALYAIYADQDPRTILPPLEHAVNVSMVILIGWAFLTSNESQRAPIVLLLVLLGSTVVMYILTGIQWPSLAPSTDFNLSRFGVSWTFIEAALSFVGVILMVIYFRNIVDAPLKAVFFLFLLVGYSGTLWQMSNGSLIGDYSGLSRLATFLAVLIVPCVVYRKVIIGYNDALAAQPEPEAAAPAIPVDKRSSQVAVAVPPVPVEVARPRSPVERESVQLLRALGLILEQTDPAEIPMRIVQATVEILKADVGALLRVKDANYADILVAYDHAMRRPIPAMLSLNLEQQITLVNAIERKQQRPLFVDRNVEELEDLYSRLDVSQMGPAYFQPLMRNDELIAILVVALPYGKRELRDAERELLKGVGIISGSLLALSNAAEDAMARAEERAIQAVVAGVSLEEIGEGDLLERQQEMQSSLDAARFQTEALQKQVATLKLELDDERTRLTALLGDTQEGLSISQRIVALNDEQDKLRNERDELAQRLQDAETALVSMTATDQSAMVTAQIETSNRERRDLEQEIESLRAQLEELRSVNNETVSETATDVINEMSRERERLLSDRNVLDARLTDIQGQLTAMGIEGGEQGLAQLVQQLYDQKSTLQARTDALRVERDALLNERRRFEQRIRKEEERETQIETMEAEIRHLATDREAITRQRDAMRQERKQLADKVDKMKQQRARLLADLSVYEDDLGTLRDQLTELQQSMSSTLDENDQLKAELHTVVNERDQLMARADGDRGRLQQISEKAQLELKAMIQGITSERNQLMQELQSAQTALQQAKHRDMADIPQTVAISGVDPSLLVSMVDSLRTPMTSIVGYIDLLISESAGLLSDMQRKFIQRISANTVRLETMLNDLSHLTALDTGTYELEREPVNVVNLLEDSLTNATYQFREKDLTVHLELDDTIPPLMLDRGAVHQVLGQLLTNAYLVTPAAGELAVSAAQMLDQSVIRVSITDSGPGIDEENRSEVFARRYRTEHQLVSGLGDTGVGLSIAKALIEAHGGRLWFDSVVGEGTTFFIELPLAAIDEGVG